MLFAFFRPRTPMTTPT
ncbi:hypothetical protein LINPERHAP1_LOCUS40518 [Linum perenne]